MVQHVVVSEKGGFYLHLTSELDTVKRLVTNRWHGYPGKHGANLFALHSTFECESSNSDRTIINHKYQDPLGNDGVLNPVYPIYLHSLHFEIRLHLRT